MTITPEIFGIDKLDRTMTKSDPPGVLDGSHLFGVGKNVVTLKMKNMARTVVSCVFHVIVDGMLYHLGRKSYSYFFE